MEQVNKLEDLINQKGSKLRIMHSLVDQLSDNHEDMDVIASKVIEKEGDPYLLAYETYRLAGRTVDIFNLILSMILELQKENEESLFICKKIKKQFSDY